MPLGADGAYLNDLKTQAAVIGPTLTNTLGLRQTSPGRYEGTFPAQEEGVYIMRVQASGNGTTPASQTVGVVVPYSPEYRGGEDGSGLLSRIASETGGRVLGLDQTGEVFQHNLRAVQSSTPIWPALLIVALLLLPFDVGVRRVSVYRGDLVRAWGAVRRRLGRCPLNRPCGVRLRWRWRH